MAIVYYIKQELVSTYVQVCTQLQKLWFFVCLWKKSQKAQG